MAAAEQAFEIIERTHHQGSQAAPQLSQTTIEISKLSVKARGTYAPALLSARLEPGKIHVLVGKSGSGKTTTAQVLMGLVPPLAAKLICSATAPAWICVKLSLTPGGAS